MTRIERLSFEGGPPHLAKAKHRREMSIGSEDHTSTDGVGKTHIPLRRGTAARSEGEAAQGDVSGVNQNVGEEPYQHPPPSLTLGHPPSKAYRGRFFAPRRGVFAVDEEQHDENSGSPVPSQENQGMTGKGQGAIGNMVRIDGCTVP